MNRTLLTSLLLTAICTLGAQSLPDPYQLAPDYMHQMLSRVIATDCRVMRLSDGGGHYLGHSRDNVFFGWGSYHTDGGNRWVGQWADGKCLFGVLVKGREGRVGPIATILSTTSLTDFPYVSCLVLRPARSPPPKLQPILVVSFVSTMRLAIII